MPSRSNQASNCALLQVFEIEIETRLGRSSCEIAKVSRAALAQSLKHRNCHTSNYAWNEQRQGLVILTSACRESLTRQGNSDFLELLLRSSNTADLEMLIQATVIQEDSDLFELLPDAIEIICLEMVPGIAGLLQRLHEGLHVPDEILPLRVRWFPA